MIYVHLKKKVFSITVGWKVYSVTVSISIDSVS